MKWQVIPIFFFFKKKWQIISHSLPNKIDMKMSVELVVILKLLEKTCISQLSWNNAYIDTHLPTHFDTNT